MNRLLPGKSYNTVSSSLVPCDGTKDVDPKSNTKISVYKERPDRENFAFEHLTHTHTQHPPHNNTSTYDFLVSLVFSSTLLLLEVIR